MELGPAFDRLSILGLRGSQPTEQVYVPEWGITITIRGLTAGERDDYDLALRTQIDEGKPRNVRGLLVAKTCLNGGGERLFKDSDADDLAALPAGPIGRLFEVAAKLSGWMATETIEKNSPRIPEPSSDSG